MTTINYSVELIQDSQVFLETWLSNLAVRRLAGL
jgi:hypothetical protein